MVENTKPVQTRDPFDRFDEAISDPRLYEADQARYQQLREQLRYQPQPQYDPQPQYEQPPYEQPQYEQPFALSCDRTDALPEEMPPHEQVPLFLSNYEEESHQQLSEYAFGSGRFGNGGLQKARAGLAEEMVKPIPDTAALERSFAAVQAHTMAIGTELQGAIVRALPKLTQDERRAMVDALARRQSGGAMAVP